MTNQLAKQEPPSSTKTQPRYPEGYWDNADEYLRQCFILQHNADYLEFLVTRVWRLDQACRFAEFGCGAGKMGLHFMPLLAEGSSYTGIDKSQSLVSKARQIWADKPWPSEFHEGSIYETPFTADSFDVTMTHTVLMHVPYPEKVLAEMIRVTKPGGLVIACEANRNAHTALLHIDEANHQEAVPLELFQTINRETLTRTGVDHNIGIKVPVLMHKAGLKQIQIRVSDAVRFLYPPVDTDDKKRLFKAICDEGYGQPAPTAEQRERWKAALIGFGIPADAAEAEITREIEEDFLNKGQSYHTVYTSLLTWSFGVV
ncbi:MAG: methyltransferase domain-containing protein [Anaerolineae bacterium]|nr:methyltransferase domain-containing protein [Anaerolineae bacterium]